MNSEGENEKETIEEIKILKRGSRKTKKEQENNEAGVKMGECEKLGPPSLLCSLSLSLFPPYVDLSVDLMFYKV